MKKISLFFFLIITCINIFAQEKLPITSGNITNNYNQKIYFKDLSFEDDIVKFINIDTKSEVTYFKKSIKFIEDASGNIVYRRDDLQKEETIKKNDWIRASDSLREKKIIRAEIIDVNGDTLKTHIKVTTNLFYSKLINELSIIKNIKTILNNVSTKYEAKDLKSLRFIDLKNVERLFLSNGKEMVELLFDGKIRWFRLFYQDSSGNVSAFDFMTNIETKQNANLGLFNNKRKKIKELTLSRPDLISMIENLEMNDENILEILKKFNE